MQNAQNQDFQARLARINGGGGQAVAQAPLSRKARKAQSKQASPLPSWRQNIGYPLKFVGAFALGMVAVFFSRYVRFHMNGGGLTGEDADLMMMIDGGMAVVIGFVLTQLFRLDAKEFKLAQTLGVLAMVTTMHNAVHAFPQPFERIFSPAWVTGVTDNTKAGSILFRGISFMLKEPERAPERKLPQIITLDSELN